MISDVQCLCSTARAATRELTRRYDDALRPAGLRTTQLSLLSRLSDEGSMPVTQLAARLGVDRTSLTRELAVLATRDLVAVERADRPPVAGRLAHAGRSRRAGGGLAAVGGRPGGLASPDSAPSGSSG